MSIIIVIIFIIVVIIISSISIIIMIIVIDITNAELSSPSSSQQMSRHPHMTHSPPSTPKWSCVSFNTHLGRKQTCLPHVIDPLGVVLQLSYGRRCLCVVPLSEAFVLPHGHAYI